MGDGFGLNCVRASQQMPKKIEGAKIALLDYNLKKYRLTFGVQVVVEDPDELEKIRDREAKITKDRIQLILDSGADVILTAKGIDDYSLKFLVVGCRAVQIEDAGKILGNVVHVVIPCCGQNNRNDIVIKFWTTFRVVFPQSDRMLVFAI